MIGSLSTFSVRQRITAAVALLTGIALLGAGFTVYLVELRRLDASIEASMSQELGEFHTLQRDVDPATNRPFASADRLLEVYFQRNLPDEFEALLSFPTTGPAKVLGEIDNEDESLPRLRTAVEALKDTGGTQTVTTPSDRFAVAVIPIKQGSRTAAFAVVHDVSESRQELRSVMVTYSAVAAASWLIVTLVAWVLAGRLLQPVRGLRETARRIAGGDLSQRIEVSGNDDLTDLSRTFNDMLDRLEAAFASQRQLLDDAGHELRTPLTILRGHLELVDANDPSEVASTRALLLDETDRMSRLVNDLLVLAKARRPDFVTVEPVDLGKLTRDLLEKCRALGPRTWVIDAQSDVTTAVDGQRLTQAVLQLADNAVRHTTDGDEIGIGSRVIGDLVEFWVRDVGPGVREEDRERVFERFQRGDEHSDVGFGLGLSIVSAITAAHGGTITLDPAHPGQPGAVFRLSVPAAVVAP